MVKEPSNGLQAAVSGDDGKIGPAYHYWSVLRCKFPGEAHPIMMHVNIAYPAKPVSNETLLDPLDHSVDARMALTLHHRVEVACIIRPRLRNEFAALLGVGFV